MESKAQVLRDMIAAVKVYVTAEVKEDLEKAELQAKFDALVAEDASLAPLIEELKAQLEALKNAAPVTPTEPVVTPEVSVTPVVEPPAPIL